MTKDTQEIIQAINVLAEAIEQSQPDLSPVLEALTEKMGNHKQLNEDLVQTLQTFAEVIIQRVDDTITKRLSDMTLETTFARKEKEDPGVETEPVEKSATQTPRFSINDLAQ
jgi:uncharacterized protein YoxC